MKLILSLSLALGLLLGLTGTVQAETPTPSPTPVPSGRVGLLQQASGDFSSTFVYRVVGPESRTVALRDGQLRTFSTAPGEYIITQEDSSGYFLSDVACTKNGIPFSYERNRFTRRQSSQGIEDPANKRVLFTLRDGEDVFCTWVNSPVTPVPTQVPATSTPVPTATMVPSPVAATPVPNLLVCEGGSAVIQVLPGQSCPVLPTFTPPAPQVQPATPIPPAATQAPVVVIRPPSTGDAGMKFKQPSAPACWSYWVDDGYWVSGYWDGYWQPTEWPEYDEWGNIVGMYYGGYWVETYVDGYWVPGGHEVWYC